MKQAPQISLNSAKSPFVFINVEHLAKVRGLSISYSMRHFREVKKLAKVKTHGIHIDKFLEFAPQVPALQSLTKEDFLRIHA